jgi:hypothetical protein
MNSYTEFLERVQSEFLASLRQAQDLNITNVASLTELASTFPTTSSAPMSAELPTPTEMVEKTFAFTNQMLEMRKEYALKLAELATAGQKQFTQTATRFAEAAKN